MSTEKRYTVWVGGSEVNDTYLTKDEADDLAQEYLDDDYDDVIIEEIVPQSVEFIKEDV